MATIYKKDEVENYTPELQLAFYKEQFESSHCENCSNELRWDWVLYDVKRLCESCFDCIREKEIADATQEIQTMESRIAELKHKYSL